MFKIFRKMNKKRNEGNKSSVVALEKTKADKAKKRAEIKENCIANTIQKTGWSREYAVNQISDARKRLGITYRDYDRYDFCNIPIDQQNKAYQDMLERKERLRRQKEQNIQSVMEKTGWDRDYTIEQITDAKKRIGITYKDYNKYDFHKVPVNKQQKEYDEVIAKKKKREKRIKKNQALVEKVVAATGWEYDYAKSVMDKSKKLCGAEYKDYYAYKFWELDDEIQKTYFTKGLANDLRKKYNTKKENISYFMNKNQFNEAFSNFLGRPWIYNAEMELGDFKQKFENEKKVIYKPLSASCGAGVTAYELNAENLEQVYNQLKELPPGVIEGYIAQHHEMQKYSQKSVNTIRMVTVYTNGEVNLLYAAFRMGGGNAIVDNFHNGGILAIIDLESGKVMTDAIDLNGEHYSEHPTTHVPIKDFQIPYWQETVDMIKKAGKVVDGIGYVGWDIAITENGPVLIEGNTAPAPNVLQLPYANQHKGLKMVVEKYL